MKRYIYILFTTVLLSTTSCFDEYNGTIDTSKFWVYFENGQVRFPEDGDGAVTARLLLSAPRQNQEVTLNYTITSEDGLTEGVDYFISSSMLTIPAGQNQVDVILLDGVGNNEIALGDRSLTITLQGNENFNAGFPGPAGNNNSIEIVIAEDDFTIYGETSFEEVPVPVDEVRYDRPGVLELNNNDGEPAVDFVATGSELGFNTSFASDDFDVESGTENMGVLNNAAITASGDSDFETTFQRGQQGFASADLDGRIEILFDEINIPSEAQSVVVELSFYTNANTTFETEDALEVFFVTNEGRGEPLMSFRGDDDTQQVTDAATGERVQGAWLTRIVELPESKRTNGQLLITMRNGADTEMILVDYVAVKGIE